MMFTKIKNICRYYWLLPEEWEGKEEERVGEKKGGRSGFWNLVTFLKEWNRCVFTLCWSLRDIWYLDENERVIISLAFFMFFSVLSQNH